MSRIGLITLKYPHPGDQPKSPYVGLQESAKETHLWRIDKRYPSRLSCANASQGWTDESWCAAQFPETQIWETRLTGSLPSVHPL